MNYVELFDAINNQKAYDEKRLKEKYQKSGFMKNFRFTKHYLNDLILKSLENYHQDRTVISKLRSLLNRIEILISKRLYSQAEKQLKKALSLARDHQKWPQMLQILANLLAMKVSFSDKARNRAVHDTLLDEAFHVLDVYQEEWNYRSQNEKLAQVYADMVLARSEEDEIDIDLLWQAIADDDAQPRSRVAKVFFHGDRATIFRARSDFKSAHREMLQVVELLEEDEVYRNENLFRYMQALNNLSISCEETGNYELLMDAIGRMKRNVLPHLPNNIRYEAYVFGAMYQPHLNYCVEYGRIEEGLEVAQKTEKALKDYDQYLSDGMRIAFYYLLAYMYFVADKKEKALDWLNHLYNLSGIDSRKEIQAYGRIMQLILHYELGNTLLVSNLVKSTYRYIYNLDKLYDFERTLLIFIRKEFPGIGRLISEEQAFSELNRRLRKVIANNPMEKRALNFFDLTAWLESKLENKTFAEVMQQKELTVSVS